MAAHDAISPVETEPSRESGDIPEENKPPFYIFKISAASKELLCASVEKFHLDILSDKINHLYQISLSKNLLAPDLNFRAVLIGKSTAELITQIQQKSFHIGNVPSETRKICFLFSGQVTEYPGMAQELYRSSPIFRANFDRCANTFMEKYKVNVKEAIGNDNSNEKLHEITSNVPNIFCVQYALMKLWNSWGARADFALGHSLGEYPAAVCAGILSLDDAIILVAEMSQLGAQIPKGGLLVVQANERRISDVIEKFTKIDPRGKMIDIALLNSESQTVLAGDMDALHALSQFCTERNIKCTELRGAHPAHSSYFDPIMEDIKKVTSKISSSSSPVENCRYISGMKGKLVESQEVNSFYWYRLLRDKIRYLDASKAAMKLGCRIFIEIGPHPVLLNLTLQNAETEEVVCLPSLKRREENWTTLLNSLATLYLQGLPIDWENFHHQFSN